MIFMHIDKSIMQLCIEYLAKEYGVSQSDVGHKIKRMLLMSSELHILISESISILNSFFSQNSSKLMKILNGDINELKINLSGITKSIEDTLCSNSRNIQILNGKGSQTHKSFSI